MKRFIGSRFTDGRDFMANKYITIDAGCVELPTPKRPTVSVVVPIYNVERYLDQALNSLEGQTLHNIEIICVNDGSTDSSPDIIREHATRDGRVRLVDKPNGGYGSACNRGIAEARGTWIAILEPDDWVDLRMFEDLVAFANSFSQPVDIVKSPYWRVWMPDTNQQLCINCRYRGRVKPASQPFTITDPGVLHLVRHHPSIWSALYRREFIERTNARFPEYPGANWADNVFLYETLCQARSIVYLDKPYYFYREETPEKTAALLQRDTFMPVERWHDMQDVLDRLRMNDPGFLTMHITRGFIYLSSITGEVDLANDKAREAAKSMFDRMDDALVFANDEVSPTWKRLYAEVKGVNAPELSSMPYLKSIVAAELHDLRYTDPRYNAQAVATFVKNRLGRNTAR